MADRVDFYFRQRVTEAELDLAFALLENSVRNLAADLRIYGVISGAVPVPHAPVPDLSIDLTAPAYGYDRLGQRLFFGSGQTVNCAVDLSGNSTDITSQGNERWLGVFLRFKRLLSDPRTDGNSQQVFFRRDESFEVVVRRGDEAPAGTGLRVALQPEELLLCDVLRHDGPAQVLAPDIDVSRRQVFVFAQGNAIGVTSGAWRTIAGSQPNVQATLDVVDAALTGHFSGDGVRHPASAVTFQPHGFVPSTDVQGAVNTMVDSLSGSSGSSTVGAAGVPGTPVGLAAGTVASQLGGLLVALNGHVAAAAAAHAATAIAATPHDYLQAPNVQGQLEGMVAALADAGATPGASRVGAGPLPGGAVALAAGTVTSQLTDLLAGLNAHLASGAAHPAAAVTVPPDDNVFHATSAQELFAALLQMLGVDHQFPNVVSVTGWHRTIHQGPMLASSKALLWDSSGTGDGPHLRVYLDGDSLWFVLNASWAGSAWQRDAIGGGVRVAALRVSPDTFEVLRENTANPTFTSWSRGWRLPLDNDAVNTAFEVSGAARETGYCGVKMYNPNPADTFMMSGNVVNFRSRFPAAPSSITLTMRDGSGVPPDTTVQNVTQDGFAFTINQKVGAGSWSFWYGDYAASP